MHWKACDGAGRVVERLSSCDTAVAVAHVSDADVAVVTQQATSAPRDAHSRVPPSWNLEHGAEAARLSSVTRRSRVRAHPEKTMEATMSWRFLVLYSPHVLLVSCDVELSALVTWNSVGYCEGSRQFTTRVTPWDVAYCNVSTVTP